MSKEKSKMAKVMPWICLAVGIPAAIYYGYGDHDLGPYRRGHAVDPTGPPVTEQTKLGLGSYVQIERSGEWYEGKVTKVMPDGTFRVHYDGWDSKYDEAVPRSRLRLNPTYAAELKKRGM